MVTPELSPEQIRLSLLQAQAVSEPTTEKDGTTMSALQAALPKRSDVLLSWAHRILACSNAEDLQFEIGSAIRHLWGAEAQVYLLSKDGQFIAIEQELRIPEPTQGPAQIELGPESLNQTSLWSAGSAHPQSAVGNADLAAKLGAQSLVLVPLQKGSQPLGALILFWKKPRATLSSGLGALSELAALNETAILATELSEWISLALAHLQAQAKAWESVRIRDEFIWAAAHELRTPLTSIKLQADLAKNLMKQKMDHDRLMERMGRTIEVFGRQTDRLSRLVDNMLDLARIEAGKLTLVPERVDLCQVVREITGRFAEQFFHVGCDLEVEAEGEVIGDWDRYRLEQVLTNLLSNAMKYGAGKPIRVAVSSSGNWAQCEVQDQGIGIHVQSKKRIFDRFERAVAQSEFEGLGLGLYISREIIEAHGGVISVESEVGHGACFKFQLPRMPQIPGPQELV